MDLSNANRGFGTSTANKGSLRPPLWHGSSSDRIAGRSAAQAARKAILTESRESARRAYGAFPRFEQEARLGEREYFNFTPMACYRKKGGGGGEEKCSSSYCAIRGKACRLVGDEMKGVSSVTRGKSRSAQLPRAYVTLN